MLNYYFRKFRNTIESVRNEIVDIVTTVFNEISEEYILEDTSNDTSKDTSKVISNVTSKDTLKDTTEYPSDFEGLGDIGIHLMRHWFYGSEYDDVNIHNINYTLTVPVDLQSNFIDQQFEDHQIQINCSNDCNIMVST